MKRWIFIFILFFLTKISLATDWFPVGAKWTWAHIDECCGPPPRPDYPFYWNAVKDTLIQNKTCHIVERLGTNSPISPQWYYRYIYNNSNDTITRFIDDKFLPVYNFNLQAGDSTYIITDSGKYSCDTFQFIIDSIKPLPQNITLRVQYGKLISNIRCAGNREIAYLSIIEKIGDSRFYSKYNFLIFDIGRDYIRCYEDSEVNLHLVDFSCDSIIDNVKQKLNTNLPIKLFPNPATNKIQIEFTDSKKYQLIKIQLVDVQGKILQSIENNKLPFLELNVADYSNGMYYLKIIADNEFVTKPIVIQH